GTLPGNWAARSAGLAYAWNLPAAGASNKWPGGVGARNRRILHGAGRQEAERARLDLGYPVDGPRRWRHVDGPYRRRGGAAGAPSRQNLRGRGPLHALSWATRRRSGGRQHNPLSLASRLFRS